MRTWLRLTCLFGPPDDKADRGHSLPLRGECPLAGAAVGVKRARTGTAAKGSGKVHRPAGTSRRTLVLECPCGGDGPTSPRHIGSLYVEAEGH